MKTVSAFLCLSWICFCTLQRFAEGSNSELPCPYGCIRQQAVWNRERCSRTSRSRKNTFANCSCTQISHHLGWWCSANEHNYGGDVFSRACPVGWKSYQNACYAAFATPNNFSYWEAYCFSLGGHLASIHFPGEMNAIREIISSGPNIGYYIGLNDIDREGFWQYTDETGVSYVNWDFLEPSGQADKDCAVMNIGGTWFDDRCSNSYGAICKRDIGCALPFTLDFHLHVDPDLLFYDNDVTITYYCDVGYYLEGESKATCTDGKFDPPYAPECEENVQCYTWRDAVCDPSSPNCDTSGNTERTVAFCDGSAQQCFVHHYTIKGSSVSMVATSGGCASRNDLMLSYGCFARAYLQTIDPSGYDELSQLEEDLGAQSDDVNVCFCDKDICNESVETAKRNDAITSDPKSLLILTGIISILAWQV